MHPYHDLPEINYWRTGVADKLWSELNFKPNVRFKLSANDKIATAGSCFAQHVARNLSGLGLNHEIYEPAPTILSPQRAKELQYGVFSARYGNIYTAKQLRQVIEFSFGLRPLINVGVETKTGWANLFRPGVQIEGFDSLHDLECDNIYHYQCVKQMLSTADCFIFTLGLTEAWRDVNSGLVFPSCPGARVGTYDPDAHKFVNFEIGEIFEDLTWCVNFVKEVNPNLRWIFTVSPVALAATATNNHVLVATSASKSTLRVATELLYTRFEHCEYFPSYEIVSSVASFGQFLEGDLRNISPRGVNLVMQVFKKSFVDTSGLDAQPQSSLHSHSGVPTRTIGDSLSAFVEAECDEVYNDPKIKGAC